MKTFIYWSTFQKSTDINNAMFFVYTLVFVVVVVEFFIFIFLKQIKQN